MNDVVRILIVDDQALFREGLRLVLDLQPSLEVVAEAESGQSALQLVRELLPDVVLMDVQMPGMDGVETTRALARDFPDVKVIILTTFDDDEYVFEGLRAGASGYLLKDADSERLVDAVSTAARGETFLQPSVASKVVAEFARLSAPGAREAAANAALENPLSPRELEILALLAADRSNRQIARGVHLSEGTIKNYVTQILSKLGADNRIDAAIRARRLGLIRGHGTS